ncbi:hypothetical protein J4732_09820 [Serratia marcescens]|uniref:Uncharacterized protein n=1 Tax=Serratia marcescens TaxID=615 RepID=A0A939NJV2_SERMA|nr:hypothetical protein [Serratia marcescens]
MRIARAAAIPSACGRTSSALAFVGVRHFHPQLTATVNHADQHADDRRYPIFRRSRSSSPTTIIWRAKNQFAERNFPRQRSASSG